MSLTLPYEYGISGNAYADGGLLLIKARPALEGKCTRLLNMAWGKEQKMGFQKDKTVGTLK